MNTKTDPNYSPDAIQGLAQDFLLRLKMEEPIGDHLEQFAQIPYASLLQSLQSDSERETFWVNVYNAFNLHLMKSDASTHVGWWGKLKHFKRRSIRIAGLRLSLMNIENDILRQGRHWWGLGYTKNPFPSRIFKALQVNSFDARIHFALNCGAMSCPPIRFYTVEEIDSQLELASRGYLQTEVHYDPTKPDHVRIAGIFRLYPGDFGGKRAIVDWIRDYRKDIPEGKLKIVWEKYDNSLHLDAFVK